MIFRLKRKRRNNENSCRSFSLTQAPSPFHSILFFTRKDHTKYNPHTKKQFCFTCLAYSARGMDLMILQAFLISLIFVKWQLSMLNKKLLKQHNFLKWIIPHRTRARKWKEQPQTSLKLISTACQRYSSANKNSQLKKCYLCYTVRPRC